MAESQNIIQYDPGRLWRAVAKTPIYPVMYRFLLFDHNPPTLQTDGRTDGRHARSISVTCRAKSYCSPVV